MRIKLQIEYLSLARRGRNKNSEEIEKRIALL